MRELQNNQTLVSHQTLRKTIGFLGLILPAILIGSGWLTTKSLQPSLSMYYHTDMRDVFVGVFTAMAILLLIYRGYARQKGEWLTDRSLTSLAALSIIGFVFIPILVGGVDFGTCLTGSVLSLTECGHYGFSALFFVSMSIFSLIQIRRCDDVSMIGARKSRRNQLYFRLGVLTIIPVSLIALFFSLPPNLAAFAKPFLPVLWLQSLVIFAISLSWMAKGGAFIWMNDHAVSATTKPADPAETKQQRRKERQEAAKMARAINDEQRKQTQDLPPRPPKEQAA